MTDARLLLSFRRLRYGTVGVIALLASIVLIPLLLVFFVLQPLVGPLMVFEDQWADLVAEKLANHPLNNCAEMLIVFHVPLAMLVFLWTALEVTVLLTGYGLFCYPTGKEPLISEKELGCGLRHLLCDPWQALYIGLRYGRSIAQHRRLTGH